MLAIAFRFPAGRYHATPWGRHVNEADVEWPPSPWRIVRALIAVWHRKPPRGDGATDLLERLLARLAASPPGYRLPPAVHAHVRHYLPVREGAKDVKVLVYDAFARVSPAAELIVAWPELVLDQDEQALLDQLLKGLNHLGRAESWVEARRLTEWQGRPDCLPAAGADETQSPEAFEPVPLLCPLTPPDYADRVRAEQDHGPIEKGKGKSRKKTPHGALPASWLAALGLETGALQAAGWSRPPAARRVWYHRPATALLPAASSAAPRRRVQEVPVTTVRYALYGRPLPLLEHAVKLGELARGALIRLVQAHAGQVPPILSGHDLPAGNRHQHAFFLPEPNRDGRIDHLLIHAPGGLDSATLHGMKQLRRLCTRERAEWKVWFEGAGGIDDFGESSDLVAEAQVWRSLTAYLHPWHTKKSFRVEDQIRKECRLRGLPALLAVEPVDEVPVGSRPRRAVHFHRFRGKRGLLQPDTRGSLWRLSFSAPIRGPLALGFGCHYGLGLFAPERLKQGSAAPVEEPAHG